MCMDATLELYALLVVKKVQQNLALPRYKAD